MQTWVGSEQYNGNNNGEQYTGDNNGEQYNGDNNGEQCNGDHNGESASGWMVVHQALQNPIAVAPTPHHHHCRRRRHRCNRRTSPLNAKQRQQCINSRQVAVPTTHHRHGQAPDTAAKPLPTCTTHRVFLSILLVSRVDTTLPMIQSTSARASPNGPRRVVFLNWHPAYCMCG
jgi:hypothetical protein